MRKNIYIRDEDQELFDKAEALGGDNFSAMIAEAVRRFVEVEEAKTAGMAEIELEVGVYYSGTSADDTKKIRFIGKKIADAKALYGSTSSRDDRGTEYTLYLTKKGKILLHREDWSRWQGDDSEASYQVYDSLTEFSASANVPGELVQEAGRAMGGDTAEYLDV
ncbi:MAG: hypothetical protein BWY65_01684 [Firmicutes bacterium ADurb.Bin373]|nr:MAG: hypothetical protein BWY65_01684 [Firmicutes bacterium ADurb.Bin373]